MSTVPDHGLKEMVPVFGPQALGIGAQGSFRAALERLGSEGDLKARLLLSALSHFAAKGYDGVQVKEVAEEAGVSKPTLYYHFGSKEGLFRQLCLVALAAMAVRIQAMVEPILATPIRGGKPSSAPAPRWSGPTWTSSWKARSSRASSSAPSPCLRPIPASGTSCPWWNGG